MTRRTSLRDRLALSHANAQSMRQDSLDIGGFDGGDQFQIAFDPAQIQREQIILQPHAGPNASTGSSVAGQKRLEAMLGGELVPQHLPAAHRQPGVLGGCTEALCEGEAGDAGPLAYQAEI